VFKRVAKEYGWEIGEMAVQPDHVDSFLSAPPKYAPARIVQIQ